MLLVYEVGATVFIRMLHSHTCICTVIFEGRKLRGFHCKLVERKILILKKKQWLKETMYSSFQTCLPQNIRSSNVTV